jgi:predicted RNA methylase
VFLRAGYTDAGVVDALGVGSLTQLGRKRIPALLRRTSGGSPLETLVRLFILGASVPIGEARRALAPMTPEAWAELGLIEIEGDAARAPIQVRYYDGLLVAWDYARATRGVLSPEYVMGISPSTLSIASVTIRRENDAALDLGTGSGFLALLASRHSERVVAVDKNPRAIEIADFNARLNGIETVDVVMGDLFEPVEGMTFDHIVSNPPFIISPDNRYFFLHSGLRGDEICRRIASVAPRYLNEGGYCQFLANWVVRKGEDTRERLAAWFAGGGCDAWVLHQKTQRADEYAATWIETEGDEYPEFETSFEQWMNYYEQLGIDAIGSGLITMRKSSTGSNWFRMDDAPETVTYPCGDDIERLFEARAFLNDLDDASLLAARLRLSPDARLVMQSQFSDGAWRAGSLTLRKQRGLQYEGAVGPDGVDLLGRCDGERELRELLAELARSTSSDLDDVVEPALATVRRLIEQGFLLPVG